MQAPYNVLVIPERDFRDVLALEVSLDTRFPAFGGRSFLVYEGLRPSITRAFLPQAVSPLQNF